MEHTDDPMEIENWGYEETMEQLDHIADHSRHRRVDTYSEDRDGFVYHLGDTVFEIEQHLTEARGYFNMMHQLNDCEDLDNMLSILHYVILELDKTVQKVHDNLSHLDNHRQVSHQERFRSEATDTVMTLDPEGYIALLKKLTYDTIDITLYMDQAFKNCGFSDQRYTHTKTSIRNLAKYCIYVSQKCLNLEDNYRHIDQQNTALYHRRIGKKQSFPYGEQRLFR